MSPYAKVFTSGSQEYSDRVKTESPTIQAFGQWASTRSAPLGIRGLGRASQSIGKWVARDPANRERNRIRQEITTLGGTSMEQKVAHFHNNPSHSSRLAVLLAADEAGQTGIRDQLGDDYTNAHDAIERRAQAIGMDSELERAVPIDHLLHFEQNNPGTVVDRNSPTINNFIQTRLGEGENMERAAPKILDGLNSNNAQIQRMSTELYHAILQNNNPALLKAFIRGGGRRGIELLRNEINNTPGGLQAINQNAFDEFERTPGGSVFGRISI